MAKFEHLEPIKLTNKSAILRSHTLPEIVHLNDPAMAVMKDFNQNRPRTVSTKISMDDALNEMRINGVHILLVEEDKHIIGLVTTEDLIGEKPIRIINERRIHRSKVSVKMLMTPFEELIIFSLEEVRYARVGNIVETLRALHSHYALVIDEANSDDQYSLCGMFSTWQIGRQLHTDIADSITSAQSVSELQKRKTK